MSTPVHQSASEEPASAPDSASTDPADVGLSTRPVTRVGNSTEGAPTESYKASEERAQDAGEASLPGDVEEAGKYGQVGPENFFGVVKTDTLEIALFGDQLGGGPVHDAKEALETEGAFDRSVIKFDFRGEEWKFAVQGSSRFHEVVFAVPGYCKVYALPRTQSNATLRVRLGARWHIHHAIEEVEPFLQDLANALNMHIAKSHVSRWDICADFPDQIGAEAVECLRGDGLAGPQTWAYRTSGGWTGLHNQTKSGVGVRIYDKRREVQEQEKAHWKAAFSAYGVDHYPHIWRVEFSLPRARLGRGLQLRHDGEVVDEMELDTLEALNRDTMLTAWHYLTFSYLWISNETREEQQRADRSTVCDFWQRARLAASNIGVRQWKPAPEENGNGERDQLAAQAKGCLASARARAGVEEFGPKLVAMLERIDDASQEDALSRFIEGLSRKLGTFLEGRGLDVQQREEWIAALEHMVAAQMDTRASYPFLYMPLVDDAEDVEERERLRHGPNDEPGPWETPNAPF